MIAQRSAELSGTADNTPDMNDLLRGSEDALRSMASETRRAAAPKQDALTQRRRKALAAARELEAKAEQAITPQQRALNAAAALEAKAAAAREEMTDAALRTLPDDLAFDDELRARQERADEILRTKMAESQPSPAVEEEMAAQRREEEKKRRLAHQIAIESRARAKLAEAQPLGDGPKAVPVVQLKPANAANQMEQDLARFSYSSLNHNEPAFPVAEAVPAAVDAPVLTGNAAGEDQLQALDKALKADGKQHQAAAVPAGKSPQEIDLIQIQTDIQKSMKGPTVVKALLLIFVGPPALIFAIVFCLLIYKASTGELFNKSGSDSPAANVPARHDATPADIRRFEDRVLRNYRVLSRVAGEQPVVQTRDGPQTIERLLVNRIFYGQVGEEGMDELMFQYALLNEFGLFASRVDTIVAINFHQNAAICGHAEALNHFRALKKRGNQPVESPMTRDARTYMRSRNPNWRDPTQ